MILLVIKTEGFITTYSNHQFIVKIKIFINLLFRSSKILNIFYFLSVLDASATIPSGILEGNVNDLGNYHQCLNIDLLARGTQIQGKYCTILVPLSADGISIDVPSIPDFELTWPPGVTLPPGITLPVPGGPAKTDGNGGDGDGGIEQPEEERIAEQFRALKTFALGIAGVNEPKPTQPRYDSLIAR